MTRRRLLIFAVVVLALAALFAAFDSGEEVDDSPVPATPGQSDAGEQVIELDTGDKPTEERVKAGTHVILRVRATESTGEVALRERGVSGVVRPAEPGTPAVFDLLLEQPQRFDVLFTPTNGETQKVATIVVDD